MRVQEGAQGVPRFSRAPRLSALETSAARSRRASYVLSDKHRDSGKNTHTEESPTEGNVWRQNVADSRCQLSSPAVCSLPVYTKPLCTRSLCAHCLHSSTSPCGQTNQRGPFRPRSGAPYGERHKSQTAYRAYPSGAFCPSGGPGLASSRAAPVEWGKERTGPCGEVPRRPRSQDTRRPVQVSLRVIYQGTLQAPQGPSGSVQVTLPCVCAWVCGSSAQPVHPPLLCPAPCSF